MERWAVGGWRGGGRSKMVKAGRRAGGFSRGQPCHLPVNVFFFFYNTEKGGTEANGFSALREVLVCSAWRQEMLCVCVSL